MSVRMRHTKAHTRNRRSHHSLSGEALTKDEKGNVHHRHRVSPTSGEYRGRKVLDVDKKIQKKEAKRKARENEENK